MADENIDRKTPETLTKYYECNEYSYDALKNNYLWASDPLTFNDPFDCTLETWNEKSFTIEKLKNHIRDFTPILPQFSERDKMIRLLLSRTGIICLNHNDKLYEDLFWGYYSKQKGFSITFRKEILSQNLTPHYEKKVIYEDENKFIRFELPDTKEEFKDAIIGWSTQKKIIWKPENEWRYIFFDIDYENLNSRKKYYSPNSIAEITLGLRFFPPSNTYESNQEQLIFIADSVEHLYHKNILAYLSERKELNTYHMFFRNELCLVPRKFSIIRLDDNMFQIQYLQ